MSEDKRLNEIIRVKKRPQRFVVLDTDLLGSCELSWKAKGILSYLLGKPDNWKVIVSDIVKHSKEGKTAVYSGLNELKELGYYEKVPMRDEKGVIVRWDSFVYESPCLATNPDIRALCPLPENPEMDNKNHSGSISAQTLGITAPYPLPENPEMDKPKKDKPDIEKPERNNNYLNNKDFSKNQSSQVKSDRQDKMDGCTLTEYELCIKNNIEYSSFINPPERALVDEIVAIILDAITTKSEYVTMKDGKKDREQVKKQLLSLRNEHIVFVIDKYKSLESPVTKKKQYILTMLYNISMEYEAHFTQY